MRAALGIGNTPLAKNKAADGTMLCHLGRRDPRDRRTGNYEDLSLLLAIVPLTGELGLAL